MRPDIYATCLCTCSPILPYTSFCAQCFLLYQDWDKFLILLMTPKPCRLCSTHHMLHDQFFLNDSTSFLSQCNRLTRDLFHKAFFQWQMTKISDKSADNQSEARISVAYNKNCHLSLMTSFVKPPPELNFIFKGTCVHVVHWQLTGRWLL